MYRVGGRGRCNLREFGVILFSSSSDLFEFSELLLGLRNAFWQSSLTTSSGRREVSTSHLAPTFGGGEYNSRHAGPKYWRGEESPNPGTRQSVGGSTFWQYERFQRKPVSIYYRCCIFILPGYLKVWKAHWLNSRFPRNGRTCEERGL